MRGKWSITIACLVVMSLLSFPVLALLGEFSPLKKITRRLTLLMIFPTALTPLWALIIIILGHASKKHKEGHGRWLKGAMVFAYSTLMISAAALILAIDIINNIDLSGIR